MITPQQCRAARALLGWTQLTLADKAKIGVVTLRQFELGANMPRRATIHVIERALSEAGVHFIQEDEAGGAGIRFQKQITGR
jgi:transcriptional regulator with XRE-family HTH domain